MTMNDLYRQVNCEHIMTDSKIIKALNICSSGIYECDCGDCYLLNYSMDNNVCMAKLMRDTKDLITRQQAEIDGLRADIKRVYAERDAHIFTNNFIKSEAVKEFAERLCEDRVSNDPVVIAAKCLLKEMVGDDNA